MLAVLIGIVPPLAEKDESLRLSLPTKLMMGASTYMIVTWLFESRSVVHDPDTNAPTLLLQATIISSIEDGKDYPMTLISPEDMLLKATQTTLDSYSSNNEDYTCELWASAPTILPLQPMGGYQSSEFRMNKEGLVIQPHILSKDQVRELHKVVMDGIEQTETLLNEHRPHLILGESSFEFQEICARSKQRFDLRLDTNETIQQLVEDYILSQPNIQEQVQEWLHREEYDFDVSVVYSKPGAEYQGWHADGNHISKDDGAYAVCLFIPLIDLSESTGYTQFWPQTHTSSQLIGFGKVAEITGSVYNGMAQAGDGIWYDYRLLHRGMPNITTDVTRPVLQVIFKKKWYVEKQNYGTESIVP